MAKAKGSSNRPTVSASALRTSLKIKPRVSVDVHRKPGKGVYTANQIGDFVTIAATGTKPNPGVQAMLVALPPTVVPPLYGMFFVEHDMSIIQIPTPFHIETHFHSKARLKTVTVVDANGHNAVKVKQF